MILSAMMTVALTQWPILAAHPFGLIHINMDTVKVEDGKIQATTAHASYNGKHVIFIDWQVPIGICRRGMGVLNYAATTDGKGRPEKVSVMVVHSPQALSVEADVSLSLCRMLGMNHE